MVDERVGIGVFFSYICLYIGNFQKFHVQSLSVTDQTPSVSAVVTIDRVIGDVVVCRSVSIVTLPCFHQVDVEFFLQTRFCKQKRLQSTGIRTT